MPIDLAAVGRAFEIPGRFLSAEPWGSGHINDTFRAEYRDGAAVERYIHQRINHRVFADPPAVMENISRVLAHLRRTLSGRRVLTLVPARDGGAVVRAADGSWWRTFLHIPGARSCDVVETGEQARECGRAFGDFMARLSDLPGPRLRETIPGFHDTARRVAALREAVAADAAGRAARAREEIAFALAREPLARALDEARAAGELPERVTHNDTKFNNVLIDDQTRKALCVIDLDTVMPGLSLNDFGDMVRTAACPAEEDERDLSKVRLEPALFRALVEGYLEAAGGLLTEGEKSLLAFSGRLITYELAVRFLTDYLSGDVYFKIHRPEHNLERARAQLKLVASIESQERELERIVRSARKS